MSVNNVTPFRPASRPALQRYLIWSDGDTSLRGRRLRFAFRSSDHWIEPTYVEGEACGDSGVGEYQAMTAAVSALHEYLQAAGHDPKTVYIQLTTDCNAVRDQLVAPLPPRLEAHRGCHRRLTALLDRFGDWTVVWQPREAMNAILAGTEDPRTRSRPVKPGRAWGNGSRARRTDSRLVAFA
ncbi:MAG: hypothetical protein HY329_11230 [Chloroflexi bacterium]|nr:hypothetical protein [Chloroflexota bacterium]